MKIGSQILNALGLITKREAKRLHTHYRGFNAAKYNRLQKDWTRTRREINAEIKDDWQALNARAFDASLNNPIVAGMLLDDRMFAVGPQGFDFQPMVKRGYSDEEDELANTVLANKFEEFSSEEYFTVTKRFSRHAIENLISDDLIIDGAFIFRVLYSGEPVKDNPFGMTLEKLDIKDIDFKYNAELSNGNTVLMGVEIDKWRRIVNVHFKVKSIYDELRGSFDTYRDRFAIPYEDLIFGYDPKHYKIVHGITALSSILIPLVDVDMWENYSIQNAKHSAAKMGFIQTSETNPNIYSADDVEESDEEDVESGKYMDVDGGTIEKLARGYQFQGFDPKFPHEQHAPFVRSNGRKICTGTGRDYAYTYGDREGESYSSGRTGELKMRGFYAYKQSIIIEQFENRVVNKWLKFALLNDALLPLQYESIKRYQKFYFQGYVRPWVDMLKEAAANKVGEDAGYISKNQIVTQSGGRLEDVFRDRVMYERYKKKYGIDIEKQDNSMTQIKVEDEPDDENKNKPDKEKRNSSLTVVHNF